MKKSILLITLGLLFQFSYAQHGGHSFRFSANYACEYIPLDSIQIENLTKGGSMTLYYPDTVVSFVFTGIDQIDPTQRELKIAQNYPNPFSGETNIDVYLPEPDKVLIQVHDLAGRKVSEYVSFMDPGTHQFTFYACSQQAYLLTVTSNKHERKQVMIQVGKGNRSVARIVYNQQTSRHLSPMEVQDIPYNVGDELRFTGFVTNMGGAVVYSSYEETPDTSKDYQFDIANEAPKAPTEIFGEGWVHGNSTGVAYEVTEQGGHQYHWEFPEKWLIVEGQGTHRLVVDIGGQSGEVTVRAENACGIGQPATLHVKAFFTVTVEATPSEGGTVKPEYAEVEVGQAISLNASPKEAWLFSQWEGDLESLQNPREVSITGDVTISAIFEADMNDWRTYFEEVPDAFPDLSKYFEETLGSAFSTVVAPIDINKSGRTDLVFHLWHFRTPETHQILPIDAPVPNTIVALVAQEDGTFLDKTEEIFGSQLVDLKGGASRKVAIADINQDGYPDLVYALNREDSRSGRTLEDGTFSWASLPVAVLSNGDGTYRVKGFGEKNYHHDVAIKKTPTGVFRIVFNGCEYLFQNDEFIASNELPNPRNLGVILAYGDLGGGIAEKLLLTTQNEIHWSYPSNITLFKRGDNYEWVQESIYDFDFIEKVDFIAWNGDSSQTNIIRYDNLKFFSEAIDGGRALSLYPDSTSIPVVFFSGHLIPEDWIVSGYLETGDFELWNKLLPLSSNGEYLEELEVFTKPNISFRFSFFEPIDINNDGYEDFAIYAYENDGPRVHLNDQKGKLHLIPQNRFPIVEAGSGWTSLFADVDGDGITDLIYYPADGCSAGHKCASFILFKGKRHLMPHTPHVLTTSISDISQNNAKIQSDVKNDGGARVKERGIVWSKYEKPTIDSNEGIIIGEGEVGLFSDSISGLEPETTYYIRAYATNSIGIGYGDELSFTTMGLLPIGSTSEATQILHSSAVLKGIANPNYFESKVTFEYGLSQDYGFTVEAEQSPLTDNKAHNVTAFIDNLIPETTYHYRIRVENEMGVVYGDNMSFTTFYGTLVDVEGNNYPTTLINKKEWTTKSLRVTKYNDGTQIPAGLNNNVWSSTAEGAYAITPYELLVGIDRDQEVLEAYGALYNWYAVNTGKLCPPGWHIPSNGEFEDLIDYLRSEHGLHNEEGISSTNGVANALKSCRQVDSPLGLNCNTVEHPRWDAHEFHYGTDDFRLSVLPSYERYPGGSFNGTGTNGYFWSSSATSPDEAIRLSMYNRYGMVRLWANPKTYGFNVRCIRD